MKTINIGVKIREARKSQGLFIKELAKMAGITQEYLGGVERGVYTPHKKTIDKIDAALDGALSQNQEKTLPPKQEVNFMPAASVKIPILGEIVAGIPIEAITDIIDYEEITAEMAKNGEYFALKVKGDSMSPKIINGDIAIIRKQPDANSGQVAVVMVGSDNATLKQVKKNRDGITLIGFNLDVYAPHVYSNEDIMSLPISILGVVVEVRRKFA